MKGFHKLDYPVEVAHNSSCETSLSRIRVYISNPVAKYVYALREKLGNFSHNVISIWRFIICTDGIIGHLMTRVQPQNRNTFSVLRSVKAIITINIYTVCMSSM